MRDIEMDMRRYRECFRRHAHRHLSDLCGDPNAVADALMALCYMRTGLREYHLDDRGCGVMGIPRDVWERISLTFPKSTRPKKSEIFVPESNIELGIKYIGDLLRSVGNGDGEKK